MPERSLIPGAPRRPAPARRRQWLQIGYWTAATLVSVVVAAGANASSHAAKPKPTLTVGIAGAFGLNSNPRDPENIRYNEVGLAYEPLIQRHVNATVSPGLATSWKVTKGNKVITLKLRKGVRFADGTPFTAAAVASWIQHVGPRPGINTTWLQGFKSVEILDDYTVRVTTKTPSPILPSAFFAGYGRIPAPRAQAASIADIAHDYLATHTVGAGPYTLLESETVAGDHRTYVPNKFYYDKSKQKWGKIVIKVVADPNAQLAALRTGQVDAMIEASQDIADAAAAAGLNVVKGLSATHHLQFIDHGGTIVKALGDYRVRQAMNFAIDRNKITAGIFGKYAVPTFVPNPTYPPSAKYAKFYTYDPAKARALLVAAGYPNGFSFKAYTALPPVCAAIAQDLAAVGITMDVVNPLPPAEATTVRTSRKYSAFCITTQPAEGWRYYNTWYKPEAGLGEAYGWHDPVIDKIWLKAQRLPQWSKAEKALWTQATDRMIEQAHDLTVYQTYFLTIINKRVGGVIPADGTNAAPRVEPMPLWYPTGK